MTKKWTVIEKKINIDAVEMQDGKMQDFIGNAMRKATYEYWLCFEGRKCHVLTGVTAKATLEAFAEEANETGFEPVFEKGKLLMDLTQKQREKLAFTFSPPLPFADEPA